MIVGSHAHRVDSNSARDQLRVGVVPSNFDVKEVPSRPRDKVLPEQRLVSAGVDHLTISFLRYSKAREQPNQSVEHNACGLCPPQMRNIRNPDLLQKLPGHADM